jgi:hypothetical protein
MTQYRIIKQTRADDSVGYVVQAQRGTRPDAPLWMLVYAPKDLDAARQYIAKRQAREIISEEVVE